MNNYRPIYDLPQPVLYNSNRNASNGVHLFHRYYDDDNIYFASLRVDGNATIKKKAGGVYNTLAPNRVFNSKRPYQRKNNPSLLPLNTWIGLRSEAADNPDGSVTLKLFIDRSGSGEWKLAAAGAEINCASQKAGRI